MEGTEGEGGGGYRLQAVVHGDGYKQKWVGIYQQEPQVWGGRRQETWGPDYPGQAGSWGLSSQCYQRVCLASSPQ